MLKRRIAPLLAALCVATLLLTACGGAGQPAASPSGTPTKGGTINVGTSEEPDTLDAQLTGMAVVNQLAQIFGGTMLAQDPKSLEYVCWLCDSYTVSSDGLTWDFKLRPDAKFQDGTPLKAADWKYTFERAKNPATKAKNAAALVKQIKSVEAVSDGELKITLDSPYAPFRDALTQGFLMPLEKAAVEKPDYAHHPVGAGPFQVTGWKSGESITLTKYAEYKWSPAFVQNQGAAYADQLVYKIIPETATRIAALESGAVDVTALDYQNVDRFKSDDKYQVLDLKRQGLGLFVLFNMDRPALQDVKVRQAINYAINRDAIVKTVLRGFGKPAYGPLPEVFFGYDMGVEKSGYHYDAAKAKQLLLDAGYAPGSDGMVAKNGQPLTLNLFSQTSGTWKDTAELLQAQLKEVGIKVEIQAYEWATLTAGLTNGKHDMSLMGYTYSDPDVLYLFLHSSQVEKGINWGKVKDTNLDKLIEAGRAATDPAQRAGIYKQIQALEISQAYWAPIYNEQQFTAISKRVQGVWMHPTKGLQYTDAFVAAK